MKKRIGSYPRVRVEGGRRGVVSQAGAVLLVEAVRKSGLDAAISAALVPWRKPRTVHDPGKILLDVALAVALGGDCLADIAVLRAEPAVFGPVASDPTVSPSPLRGPHPKRPRHRPAQPSPARHRPEPLAGDRLPRARPPRLAAHARPDRRHPPLGTQPDGPGPTSSPTRSTDSTPCRPPADQQLRRPDNPHHPTGEVEPGAHPTRESGPHPAPPPEKTVKEA